MQLGRLTQVVVEVGGVPEREEKKEDGTYIHIYLTGSLSLLAGAFRRGEARSGVSQARLDEWQQPNPPKAARLPAGKKKSWGRGVPAPPKCFFSHPAHPLACSAPTASPPCAPCSALGVPMPYSWVTLWLFQGLRRTNAPQPAHPVATTGP